MGTSESKVALVTGAARGIGLGIATSFLKAGYRVALIDRDRPALDTAVAEISHNGASALGFSADLTVSAQIKAAVAEISDVWGSIDVLVNNAGILRDHRLVNMSEEDWDSVIATNLKSQFLTSKSVAPGMIDRGFGRIINISSRAWLGAFGQANYSAAKGGVVSLTRSLALELATKQITVNAIAPGIVDTQIFRNLDEGIQEKLKKSVPVRRIGTPDDVARAALFFADPSNGYITGQVLYVCGGRSLGGPSL